jgi:RNA polymerase sigma-70 factor (ECF subfamily)
MSDERSAEWSAEVESVYRNQARELWALFYVHCMDADRAYEALQEAFVRLQEQNGTPIRNMRAWLLRVGRNWLRDVARRKSNATRSSEHLDELAVSQEEPSSIMEQRERQSQVREALAGLRVEDREVLVLRYAMGWSSKRIAEVLSSTASAVDMRLSRARRRLGDILEKSGVGNEQR